MWLHSFATHIQADDVKNITFCCFVLFFQLYVPFSYIVLLLAGNENGREFSVYIVYYKVTFHF